MQLAFSKIDHVHVFVKDRATAEPWYEKVFGLTRIKALEDWATETGPLVLGNDDLHLALFNNLGDATANKSVIAFRVSMDEINGIQSYYNAIAVPCTYEDHDQAVSLYLQDPDGNPFEITAYR